MDTKLLIFSIICVLCWGIVIYGVTRVNADVIEVVDDEAWACQALNKADLMGIHGDVIGKIAKGDSLHLLASASDKPEMVMVQTADGLRGWVDNAILPNYYKIRSIEIDEPAHFNAKTFAKKIVGQDFETLEKRYAAALQVVPNKKTKANPDENGFSAVFPMRVHTNSAMTTAYAMVLFEDGKAVAVSTDSLTNKKAKREHIDPLIPVFLDHGILTKAGQKAFPAYTSKLPAGVEKAKGQDWVNNLARLLLGLIGLIILAAFPVLLVSPFIVLVFMYVYDGFYRWLIAIPLALLSIIVFFTFYSIVSSVSIVLLVFNIIAAIAMLIFCESTIY